MARPPRAQPPAGLSVTRLAPPPLYCQAPRQASRLTVPGPHPSAPGHPPLLLSLGALNPGRAWRSRPLSGPGPSFTPPGPRPPSGAAPPPSSGSPGPRRAWGLRGPSRLSVIRASVDCRPAPTRSGPPFTRFWPFLAAPANPSGLRRSEPCPSVSRSTQLGTRGPGRQSVRFLQPRAVRKASAPRAFRRLPQPHPLTLQSAGCPRPAAWPPQSRPPRSVRQTAEAARRQSGYVALGLASWP